MFSGLRANGWPGRLAATVCQGFPVLFATALILCCSAAGFAAAHITGVTLPPNGTYTEAQILDFEVHYSEPVWVHLDPVYIPVTGHYFQPQIWLPVQLDSGTALAPYFRGTGSTTLIFRYLVARGDVDADGLVLAANLTFNYPPPVRGYVQDTLITDGAGNRVDGAQLPPTPENARVLVEGNVPAVTVGPPSASRTCSGPVVYTVTYADAFNLITLSLSNVRLVADQPCRATITVAGAGQVRTVTLTDISASGNVKIRLAEGTARDARGSVAPAALSTAFGAHQCGITSIVPASGLADGGVVVLVAGQFPGFADPGVTIGGVPALAVDVQADGLRVATPPQPPDSPVDVVVFDGTVPMATVPRAYTPLSRRADGSLDSDGDTLPDNWELLHGLDALNPGDADADSDLDGASNRSEYVAGTHPNGTWVRALAEGITREPLGTTLTAFNPNAARTSVVIRFMREDGVTVPLVRDLAGGQRLEVDVAQVPGLEVTSFGTVVEAHVALAIESTVRWGVPPYGAHTEVASPVAEQWSFAEGATMDPFDLFYVLVNPGDGTADVQATFLSPPPGAPSVHHLQVGPHSRATMWVDTLPGLSSAELAAQFTSRNGVPITVERAMYFSGDRWWSAGARAAGSQGPSLVSYFAEGVTSDPFDTFLLLANPSTSRADVKVDYLFASGPMLSSTYEVAPESRRTIRVNDEAPELSHADFGCRVQSTNDVGIVAERAVWWTDSRGLPWTEGHASGSANALATRWAVADLALGGPQHADAFLLVLNPGDSTTVAVVLYFDDGTTRTITLSLRPGSRTTIPLSVLFPDALDRRFSATVDSVPPGPPIVVEKAVYWDADGVQWSAGVNARATPVP